MTRSQTLVAGAIVLLLLLVLSGIQPFDRTTWILEVVPVLIALPLLGATYRRFPLTNLAYVLIFCHAIVLMAGGAYSYARVPLGFEIADLLHLSRNPYDKLGHFFQGLVPAVIAREVLIRGGFVRTGMVASGYIAAFVLASWVLAIYVNQTSGPDRDASSGRYAFGDGLLFIFMLGAGMGPLAPDIN